MGSIATANEVRIRVTIDDQVDKGLAASRVKVKAAGKAMGDDLDRELQGAKPRLTSTLGDAGADGGKSMADALKGSLRSNERGIAQELGGIGDSGGASFAEKAAAAIDRDLPRHVRSKGTDRKLGGALSKGSGGWFSKEFAKDVSMGLPALMSPAGLAIGAALVAAAAPALAGVVPLAAALGVGGIGLAVAAALVKDEPVIKSAVKKLHDHLFDMDIPALQANVTKAQDKLKADQAKLLKANVLGDSDKVKNSIKYDIEIDKQSIAKAQQDVKDGLKFNELNSSLKDLARPLVPQFQMAIDRVTQLFDKLQPQIGQLFANLGPSIGPLMDIIDNLATNAMPGLVSLAKTFSETLADPKVQKAFKGLSETLGVFLSDLSTHGTAINVTFVLLLNTVSAFLILLQSVIDWPGRIRDAFVSAFLFIQLVFLNLELKIVQGIGKIAELAAKIPGPWQGIFKSLQDQAGKMANKIQDDINKIHGKDVTITITTVQKKATFDSSGKQTSGGEGQSRGSGFAHGGVRGAAAFGGVKSGYTLVGEHGPEIARLPTGSTVYTNAQSRGMMDGGSGPVRFIHEFVFSGGDSGLGTLLLKMQRDGHLVVLTKSIVNA